jgi:alpha-galactosidase
MTLATTGAASLRAAGDVMELTLDGRPLASLQAGSVELDRRDVGGVRAPMTAAGASGSLAEGLVAEWSADRIGGQDVWELRLVLRNESDASRTLTRMDPLRLALDPATAHWRTTWYRSAWGDEYRPCHGTTRHDALLEVRSGRSSHGMAPWLGLEAEDGSAALIVTPAWSGNWHITALSRGAVSAGISPWQLDVELAPGEAVTAPSVVIAAGTDLEQAALGLQRAVRDAWLPRTSFSDSLPTEWNHWWPYEDVEIDEAVIARNARGAASVGVDVVTVDAGWFGAPDAASDWQEQRGDWTRVNTERFPAGLTALGAAISDAGVLPGIWIEAEAVGRSAQLRTERPAVLARSVEGRRHDPAYRVMTVSLDPDDPGFLGYVCLGSPEGREHVLDSMTGLIERFGSRWIKLDFNIDPDAGCTRTDHGHGRGDGLLRHYEGLYAVLDEVRRRHPEVLLEACSSGGMRIDLGLARHVHAFFLSDPDYTEHHLEVLHGAARMLPPLGILHWSHSQWRGEYDMQQRDWPSVTDDEFDAMLRAAMLHRFGISLRLTELVPRLRDRLSLHLELFRSVLAPLVREGVLRALTPPPERGGLGERAPVFQLTDEAADRHVVAAFVLDGGTRPDAIRPRGLEPQRGYVVTDLATGDSVSLTGSELSSAGVALSGAPSVTSWLRRVEPQS